MSHALCDAARWTLVIGDEGFIVPTTLNELAARGHFGLVELRERVELIGGALIIESAPGAGTIVRVAWQMARNERQEASGDTESPQ